MKAFDLFCGAGGASLGLHRAGFEVLGFEIWDAACRVHDLNGFATVRGDLDETDWAGFDAPDLLWASPPCQPFSKSGSRLGATDDRNGVPAFLRAVVALRPRAIAMENVMGLATSKHRWYLDFIVNALVDLGYEARTAVLDAADFGVPQRRQRVFVIARNDGGALVWPEPTHARGGAHGLAPWRSLAEGLGEPDGVVPLLTRFGQIDDLIAAGLVPAK